MATIANIRPSEGGHWYYPNGQACYEVPKKDGKGMTKTTLRHARLLGLIPSVTTILKTLDKPALTSWKIEQAVLAVVTTPRLEGEEEDAFIKRVLDTDKEQDKEAAAAADLGTEIHQAIEDALNGKDVPAHLKSYVDPVLVEVAKFGNVIATQSNLVGDGYAGKTDVICADSINLLNTIVDFKTTKKLPKESYPEHQLQLSAYSKAHKSPSCYRRRTANIYISTLEAGKIMVCVNENVEDSYLAFSHLCKVWQWLNSYIPPTL